MARNNAHNSHEIRSPESLMKRKRGRSRGYIMLFLAAILGGVLFSLVDDEIIMERLGLFGNWSVSTLSSSSQKANGSSYKKSVLVLMELSSNYWNPRDLTRLVWIQTILQQQQEQQEAADNLSLYIYSQSSFATNQTENTPSTWETCFSLASFPIPRLTHEQAKSMLQQQSLYLSDQSTDNNYNSSQILNLLEPQSLNDLEQTLLHLFNNPIQIPWKTQPISSSNAQQDDQNLIHQSQKFHMDKFSIVIHLSTSSIMSSEETQSPTPNGTYTARFLRKAMSQAASLRQSMNISLCCSNAKHFGHSYTHDSLVFMPSSSEGDSINKIPSILLQELQTWRTRRWNRLTLVSGGSPTDTETLEPFFLPLQKAGFVVSFIHNGYTQSTLSTQTNEASYQQQQQERVCLALQNDCSVWATIMNFDAHFSSFQSLPLFEEGLWSALLSSVAPRRYMMMESSNQDSIIQALEQHWKQQSEQNSQNNTVAILPLFTSTENVAPAAAVISNTSTLFTLPQYVLDSAESQEANETVSVNTLETLNEDNDDPLDLNTTEPPSDEDNGYRHGPLGSPTNPLTIMIQLSGEMGNHISKFAFGYALGWYLQDDFGIESIHYVLRHQDLSKWLNARKQVQLCWPRLRDMNFEEGNNETLDQRRSLVKEYLKNENITWKDDDDEDNSRDYDSIFNFNGFDVPYPKLVKRVQRALNYAQVINTMESGGENGMIPRDVMSLPILEINAFANVGYFHDRYLQRLQSELFVFEKENPECCSDKEKPFPDEHVFHLRNFLVEMRRRGKQLGFEELSPRKVATDLYSKLEPGEKVAITSRFTKPNDVDPYIQALQEEHNASVRVIRGMSFAQDFCFLLQTQREFVGYTTSTYALWAGYLGNASLVRFYSVQSPFRSRRWEDGGIVKYNWTSPTLRDRVVFDVYKSEEQEDLDKRESG